LFVVPLVALTDVLLLLTLLLLVTGLTDGLVGGLVVIREDEPGLLFVFVFDLTTVGVDGVLLLLLLLFGVFVFGNTGAGVEGGRLVGLLGVVMLLLGVVLGLLLLLLL